MSKRKLITIGLAHINTTVGDFEGNTDKILRFMDAMALDRNSFALMQESAFTGYPAEELVTMPDYQDNQLPYLKKTLEHSAKKRNSHTIYTIGGTFAYDGRAFNVVYVIGNGHLWGIVPKRRLPEYNIFFDARVFAEGIYTIRVNIPEIGQKRVPFGDILFRIDGTSFTVSVCEDIWTPAIISEHSHWGSEHELNNSAAPFRTGVVDTRYEMLATRSADEQMVVAYTSQVGGQGGIVFDGDGYVFANGRLLRRSKRWNENFESVTYLLNSVRSRRGTNTTWRREMDQRVRNTEPIVVTIPMKLAHKTNTPVRKGSPFIPEGDESSPEHTQFFEDIVEALVMGLGDYIEKTKVFKRAGINSSGGADSALVAIITYLYAQRRFAQLKGKAKKAAIRDFVNTFSWPTRFNDETTKSIARDLAEELGINFTEKSIEEEVAREVAFQQSLYRPGWIMPSLTHQNLQAEIRARKLSEWCGANEAIFLNTSNMSEKAVGYGTKRGDMLGDLAVISNIPKTLVYALLRYFQRVYQWKFLDVLLTTKATAGLAEDQEDERDLMPFIVLDTLIFLHLGDRLGATDCYLEVRNKFTDAELAEIYPGYEVGMLKQWTKKFFVRFYHNIHKWVGTPEGIHVGGIDLDRERATHLPTVTSLSWLNLDAIDELPD